MWWFWRGHHTSGRERSLAGLVVAAGKLCVACRSSASHPIDHALPVRIRYEVLDTPKDVLDSMLWMKRRFEERADWFDYENACRHLDESVRRESLALPSLGWFEEDAG